MGQPVTIQNKMHIMKKKCTFAGKVLWSCFASDAFFTQVVESMRCSADKIYCYMLWPCGPHGAWTRRQARGVDSTGEISFKTLQTHY